MIENPCVVSPVLPSAIVTVPTLFLSSKSLGWEGVVAGAFHEPDQLERWVEPINSNITLIQCLQGTMWMEALQPHGRWHSWHLQPGDLILKSGIVAPGEVRWWSRSAAPLQTLQVQLQRERVERTAVDLTGRGTTRLDISGRTGFRDPLLKQLGLTLLHELEQGAPGGTLYAQTVAQVLTMHLLRQYAQATIGPSRSLPKLTTRQLRQVDDYIQAHLHQNLSLDQLAQQISLSPSHFGRAFRQKTGKSPHQFVLQQRIVRAQTLLALSDLPMATIAGECGFAHQSHLTMAFTRFMGTSPRAYRLSQRNTAPE